MNEWSTKGYYSGSATTDQRPQTRLYRQYWEENLDQGYSNTGWAMNGYKVRDYQKPNDVSSQLVTEDIGIPPTYTSKKKKNGGSDPRFRKVISTEYRAEDLEVDKYGSMQKGTRPMYEPLIEDDKVISFLKIPNDASFFTSPSLKKIDDQNENSNQEEVTKDLGFQPGRKYYQGRDFQDVPKTYRESEKIKTNSSMNLKRSASDCTLSKKKGFGDENADEASDKVRAYPSATRITKVHNWIKGYNVVPEKRRSVITVIGQTQTKPFSKILSEINQRRKLAKELDKHALCEAIMGSTESQSDVKNIVAKVDLVLPDGKVIYSTEKVYLSRESKLTDSNTYTRQSMEVLEAGDQKKKRFDMIPEKDSSVSQVGKKNRTRRSNKKISLPKEKLEDKGDGKKICDNVSSILIWFLLGMLCFSLCFSVFFYMYKPSHSYFVVDFFRPKTTAWYEKLLFS